MPVVSGVRAHRIVVVGAGSDASVFAADLHGVGHARVEARSIETLTSHDLANADAIVLDLRGATQNNLVDRVRNLTGLPLMVLSSTQDDLAQITAFDRGADDYVVWPVTAVTVVARLDALVRRSSPPGPRDLPVAEVVLNPDGAEVAVRGRRVALPQKELQLLTLLMSHEGTVVSRRCILDQVWGQAYLDRNRTLDVHIKRLRAKIEKRSRRPQHLITVRGMGYKFVGGAEKLVTVPGSTVGSAESTALTN
jgi:two-component system response regulator RegX3